MKKTINPRFLVLLLAIVAVASTRLLNVLGHFPLINFTPIGAMALFGGAYFSSRSKAILLPILTLFASDLIINLFFYHGKYGVMYHTWYVVYGTFALIVLLGRWILKKIKLSNFLLAAVSASLAHWLITDFGVWLAGTDVTTGLPFTKDLAGLVKCYALALPFLKSFLSGTIIYGAIMFGAFELAQRKFPVLAISK